MLTCYQSTQQPCGYGQARIGVTDNAVIVQIILPVSTFPAMQTVRTHHSRVGVEENEDKWRTDSPSGTVQGRGGEWVPRLSLKRTLRLRVLLTG